MQDREQALVEMLRVLLGQLADEVRLGGMQAAQQLVQRAEELCGKVGDGAGKEGGVSVAVRADHISR